MSSNGRFTASELAPIAGGGYLAIHDYRNPGAAGPAAAWNALAAHVEKVEGVRIAVTGPMSAYRTYAEQLHFWQLYQSGQGNQAAYPGTSNHGMGINVDVPTYVRALIDKYGPAFGWSKSWSDAPNEWWHITYQTGHYQGPDPGPGYTGPGSADHYPELHKGDHGDAVKRLQKHLRRWNLGMTRPEVDGGFGEKTADAVREFQIVHDLDVDGVVGKGTWKVLRRPDHFGDAERSHINRIKLLRSGDNITDAEAASLRVLRAWCQDRADDIKKQAANSGWDKEHRRERYHVLNNLGRG